MLAPVCTETVRQAIAHDQHTVTVTSMTPMKHAHAQRSPFACHKTVPVQQTLNMCHTTPLLAQHGHHHDPSAGSDMRALMQEACQGAERQHGHRTACMQLPGHKSAGKHTALSALWAEMH